jgi:ABC-type Fe3+ transport system permease subunit
MTNTEKLLDKARRLCKPDTWYALAKRLGISQQRLSNCRTRHATLNNEAAFKLAALLRMPVADVIAYMEEDRAKAADDEERATFWSHQLPRVLPAIAIGTALLLAVPGDLIAGPTKLTSNITTLLAIHYANFRRWLRNRAVRTPRASLAAAPALRAHGACC